MSTASVGRPTHRAAEVLAGRKIADSVRSLWFGRMLPNRPSLDPVGNSAIKARWSLVDLQPRPTALDRRADLPVLGAHGR
jgi:hypothetical protein